MALIITLHCSCGKEYLVYVPKRVLYKEIFGGSEVELGKLLDEYERNIGEIALAGEAGELSGFEFRDIGVNEVIQCRCGRVIDMLRLISLGAKYPEVSFMQYEEVRMPQAEV